MSTRIKGITIELSADASGLETALKQTNKALSDTQKQLTSVNKSLKLDPGNADLLEQKYRLLGSAIDESTQKLQALKAAQASIKESGGSQSQYDALTREISDTSSKLQDMKKEQDAVGISMLQAQGQATAFGQAMTKVGSVAGEVANATMGLSMAAAGAVTGLAALVTSAASSADELLTLSRNTGLSTDELQKMKYASERIDVPLSTITSAVERMKNNLNKSTDAWANIGVKVKDANGNFKSTEQIFQETLKALSRIDNETQRDAEAMKIFGRNAGELSGLIDDGGAALARFGQEAEQIGGIIPEEDLKKLGEFQDVLDQTKAKLSAAFAGVALNVLEAMSPVIESVCNALQTFSQIVANIPAPITQFVVVALLLLAALAPAAMVISSTANALGVLAGILPAVGAAIGQMVSAASAAIAGNPYVGIILAIVAALAALAIAIYAVVTHLEEIKAVGASAFDGIKSAAQKVLQPIGEIKEKFVDVFDAIPGVVNKAVSAFGALVNGAKQMVSKVVTIFAELQDKAFSLGNDMMSAFTSGINAALGSVINALYGVANAVSGILNGTIWSASNAGSSAGRAYADSFNSSASNIDTPRVSAVRSSSSSASEIGTAVADALTSASPTTATTATASGTPVQVTVELVGSAKNIFETVRVENNTLATATGYHALA